MANAHLLDAGILGGEKCSSGKELKFSLKRTSLLMSSFVNIKAISVSL
jgi:hypothetical protein